MKVRGLSPAALVVLVSGNVLTVAAFVLNSHNGEFSSAAIPALLAFNGIAINGAKLNATQDDVKHGLNGRLDSKLRSSEDRIIKVVTDAVTEHVDKRFEEDTRVVTELIRLHAKEDRLS